jgi:hypothetical protein
MRLRRVRHLCRHGRWSRRRQRGLRRLLLCVLLLLERILGMRLGLRLVVLRVAAVGRRSEQAGREHRREHSSLKNEEEANAVDKSVKHSQQY